MKKEKWKPALKYENTHEISSTGRVRSIGRLVTRKNGRNWWLKGRVLRLHTNSQTGYKQVGLWINGKEVKKYVHRLVIEAFRGPIPPNKEVDHKNRNRQDNHLKNLRLASTTQSKWNSSKHNIASSLHKGVSWCKLTNKWRVRISINKCQRELGKFVEEKEAAKAYNHEAQKHFGKFAVLNDVR